MHQFTVVTSFEVTYVGACVFSCNLPSALSATWLEPFTRYSSNGGGMDTEMSQHKSWPWRRQFSHCSLNLQPFNRKSSPALPMPPSISILFTGTPQGEWLSTLQNKSNAMGSEGENKWYLTNGMQVTSQCPRESTHILHKKVSHSLRNTTEMGTWYSFAVCMYTFWGAEPFILS